MSESNAICLLDEALEMLPDLKETKEKICSEGQVLLSAQWFVGPFIPFLLLTIPELGVCLMG